MSEKKLMLSPADFISEKSYGIIFRLDELQQKTQTFINQLNTLHTIYNDVDSIGKSYLELKAVELNNGDYVRDFLKAGIEVAIAKKKEQIQGQCKLIDSLLNVKQ